MGQTYSCKAGGPALLAAAATGDLETAYRVRSFEATGLGSVLVVVDSSQASIRDQTLAHVPLTDQLLRDASNWQPSIQVSGLHHCKQPHLQGRELT